MHARKKPGFLCQLKFMTREKSKQIRTGKQNQTQFWLVFQTVIPL